MILKRFHETWRDSLKKRDTRHVGHNEPLETILDLDLKKYEVIWAAAGTPFTVFQLKPTDLEPLTKGRWVDLSEEI